MAESGKKYVFALVGATGAVGKEVLSVLSERGIPLKELRLAASEKSAGKPVEFGGEEVFIKKLSPEFFTGVDIAFFTAGSNVSKEFAPMAAKAGAVVIDNTSAFRMDKDIPLSVPEVNPEVLKKIPERRIFSVPNCSTIQMAVALAPLHAKARIRRIVVSTYQSTSGAGRKAMEELSKQVTDLFNYRESTPEVFPHRIAFNVLPDIGGFNGDGASTEEEKICEETKKILGDPQLGVSATAVRVPTFHCHAESVNIETERPLSPEEAKEILSKAPGVTLVDEPSERIYPLLSDAQGQDEVYVGRIRKDGSRANCLNLWIVADNLRKGAALNGIQIAERLIANGLI